MSIDLTETAAAHFKESLQERGKGIGIMIGIKTSGCSGLSYVIEYIDNVSDDCKHIVMHNVNLYIKNNALQYLQGSVIDFKTEGLNSGIDISNPNIKDSCGCGSSFTV